MATFNKQSSIHLTCYFNKLISYFMNFPKFIFQLLRDTFIFFYLRYYGVDTKFGYVILKGLPIIKKHPGSKVSIGKGATLISKSKYNVAGINHPVILATLSSNAIIKIGYVGLSGATLCAATKIEINDFSGIGANSKLYDTDFHSIDPALRKNGKGNILSAPIILEENVWIASDVTILKGVHIGEGSIVAAGSIVTKDIPSFEVYAGNPAKKIKSLKLENELPNL